MLAYTTLGVTDFERANAFYASLLSVIDAGHVMGNERIALYGTDVQNPMLAICIPYDEKPASSVTARWWRSAQAVEQPVTRCTPKPSH